VAVRKLVFGISLPWRGTNLLLRGTLRPNPIPRGSGDFVHFRGNSPDYGGYGFSVFFLGGAFIFRNVSVFFSPGLSQIRAKKRNSTGGGFLFFGNSSVRGSV